MPFIKDVIFLDKTGAYYGQAEYREPGVIILGSRWHELDLDI